MAAITFEEFKRRAYASYLDMVAIPTAEEALADPEHPAHAGAQAALDRFRAERAALGDTPRAPAGEIPRSRKGVPLDGRVAFEQGWNDRANPHPKHTPARLWWDAHWRTANAEAFEAHCSTVISDLVDIR